ncbi:pyridine nucleotide-disulfide oxidoreductase [Terribacillus saccharophilus]|jgi:NADH:ubiquinone reductase (H+-translocating)|uniref:Pyridine nucleotide-disulfide oxidoreductase n=1 Tax=Terribacillus saccharophilus TaxID=361277 RepID=A0A268HDH4_9BACI|nr:MULTISPECIES: NAD(P)/FAD-dependent oxidoreductase [Terribacillus]PAD33977.1 pyridine nucleotide-disulfide oxidoreductase [Terribacillus saccharophilus]PAD94778.1 pyridine nucleotide-disulfide oxidoreductase [Terribacillus saccharophilus]PAD98450.1 pyridine nucleotide-disulfide oxidoreductase [Terribacillus saccharophilus]PAE07880.1 pyridine nucleotide-disulfide oxidoreductase [Terribacillus saccharophilus]VVM35025.1 NADH dehydrogenase (EC 1.6.99.3) [Terribacillus sp. AE2B 122]
MAKNIVILGAGYGGVLAAQNVRKYYTKAQANVTLINKTPTHQIITELHRLAAGSISEQAVAMPVEKLLKGLDVDFKVATVEGFNVDKKEVVLAGGNTLSYDALVVGLGSKTAYFGIPGLEENSLVLKSADDANKVFNQIQDKIKAYAASKNPADATILIGGGGLTGVELVGEIADKLASYCLPHGVDPKEIKLQLVEAGPKVLPMLPQHLIDRAQSSLEKRGVEFLLGLPVTNVEGNVVELKDGQKIETNTFVWTGGVQALPMVAESGLETDRGRATVNNFLQSKSHQDVFVVGDSAVYFGEDGRPWPPTAQIAWQMGELVGYNLFAYLEGKTMENFSPINSGTLASLGRKDAVAFIGANQTPLKGLPATMMKEASNIRYLTHVKGLFSLAY